MKTALVGLFVPLLCAQCYNIGYKHDAISFLVSPYQKSLKVDKRPSATGRSASSARDEAGGPLLNDKASSFFGYQFSFTEVSNGYR